MPPLPFEVARPTGGVAIMDLGSKFGTHLDGRCGSKLTNKTAADFFVAHIFLLQKAFFLFNGIHFSLMFFLDMLYNFCFDGSLFLLMCFFL